MKLTFKQGVIILISAGFVAGFIAGYYAFYLTLETI